MTKRGLVIVLIVLIAAGVLTACIYFFGSQINGNTAEQRIADKTEQATAAAASAPMKSTSPAPAATREDLGYPVEWADGGIFSDFYKKAYEKLSQMSMEEKVGQMFLASGTTEETMHDIEAYHLGGLLLFEQDFTELTADEAAESIALYQEAADIPLIMAVDEEGGTVVRISSNPAIAAEKFKSPQDIYESGGLQAVEANAKSKAALLYELGLNLNLAPVADVSEDPEDYMYKRTLGKPADETAEYVAAVVHTMQNGGISSAVKHFPGYGGNTNTHNGIALDERPMSEFENSDFIPFEAGIEAGCECVLVAHNIVACMDETLPASLSPDVHEILRERMGFSGIILTDDLSMDAISQYTMETDPAVTAVLAGNDMLVTPDCKAGTEAILEALDTGTIKRERIDRAVFRILAWKYAKGILIQ